MTKDPLHVLLVDDEVGLRKSLARHLREKFEYHVVEAATFDEALTAVAASQHPFAVALLDNMLMRSADAEPERLGLDLMHAIRQISPYTEFILFTGYGLEKDWQAIEQGAFRFLSKASFDANEVGHLVRQAAEFGQLKMTAQEKHILEQLMKTSPMLLRDAKLEDILNAILRAVLSIGFDRVRLYLLSDDRQHFIGQAHIGMASDFIGLPSQISQHPNIQALFETQQPIIVERQLDVAVPFAHDDRLTQWACIPLVVQGEVIGKVGVDKISSQQPLTETELHPVAIFVNQAASAIQTARLRQKQDDRQHKLEVIRQVTEKLNNKNKVTFYSELN